MENTKDPKVASNNKKLLPIILAVLAIIIVIVLVVVASKKGEDKPLVDKKPVNQGQETPSDNVDEDGNPLPPTDSEEIEGDEMMGEGEVEEINPALVDAEAVVEGANLISKDKKVILDSGEEVKTDLDLMDARVPRQTGSVNRDELPGSVIDIEVGNNGFTPSEFRVKAGAPVTLALTSIGKQHNIQFDDPAMKSVAIAPSSGETRVTTFNAPSEPGEYTFYCGVIFHADRGERGVMIVE